MGKGGGGGGNCFIVEGVYNVLTHHQQLGNDLLKDLIWNNVVPLKVSLFVWRVMNKRIPIWDNLLRRGLVLIGSLGCSNRCDQEEITNHLFMKCDFLVKFGTFFFDGWRFIRSHLLIFVYMNNNSRALTCHWDTVLFSGNLVGLHMDDLKRARLKKN